ncbi:MAG: hypothetical protein K2Z81_14050 [Cyanobacteria bacterium]|nr:hypothetical protein [Cyanobacteriota bacterium]
MIDLPSSLSLLAQQPIFWERYLWMVEDEHQYSELITQSRSASFGPQATEAKSPSTATCRFDFSLSSGYGLAIETDPQFCSLELILLTPVGAEFEIAWDDQAHWHPHALRWIELEVVCKAVGMEQPDLQGLSGLTLLLLARFTAIMTDDEWDYAQEQLSAEFERLGITNSYIQGTLMERIDCRNTGCSWKNIENGWVVSQSEGVEHDNMCYSLRNEENDSFPLADLGQLVESALDICEAEELDDTDVAESESS